jgi:hypothetical protein
MTVIYGDYLRALGGVSRGLSNGIRLRKAVNPWYNVMKEKSVADLVEEIESNRVS